MLEGMNRQAYPSDLTDAQWDVLAPLLPPPCSESMIYIAMIHLMLRRLAPP